MVRPKARALVLTDLESLPPESQDYSDVLDTEEWRNQADVVRALESIGFEAKLFAIHDSLYPLIEELRANPPDIVFNLCEGFRSDRRFEPHVAGLLELMGIPFTGSGSEALHLCKDKGLTKKILSYHRIRVPRFVVSHKSRPLRTLKDFTYPAFVKPLGLEASEGIAQLSFVESEKEGLERVRFLHEKFNTDVIVEEFIEGRELYVGMLGKGRPEVFPPRELIFGGLEDSDYRFATFKAKWDEGYRKKHKIQTAKAEPIDPKVLERMRDVSKKIYKLFRLEGYARLDFRLRPNGDLVFIEANPNPSIAREEDYAAAAKLHGYAYEQLIDKIVKLGYNGG